MGLIPGLGRSLMLLATKPMGHNYWSLWTLEPMLHNKRNHCTKRSPHLLKLGKAHGQQWRPSTAKNKIFFLKERGGKIRGHLMASNDTRYGQASEKTRNRNSVSPSPTRHWASLVAQYDKRICLQYGRPGFVPWVVKSPWRREQLPTPVFWPGEFHGQRSLLGYSPWGCKESDTTEPLSPCMDRCSELLWGDSPICYWLRDFVKYSIHKDS